MSTPFSSPACGITRVPNEINARVEPVCHLSLEFRRPARRTINPRVLAVAHEIGPRAVAYAERLLGDAALTMNLFEESAAAVSEALRRKSKDARPVRDLSAYLYRTFLRKISLARGKQTRLETSLRNNARTQFLARQRPRWKSRCCSMKSWPPMIKSRNRSSTVVSRAFHGRRSRPSLALRPTRRNPDIAGRWPTLEDSSI